MKKAITIVAMAVALAASAVHAKPLTIYILVGQSNMQGHGQLYTVPYMADDPATRPLHDKIVDATGNPKVHENVRIIATSEAGKGSHKQKSGPLTMGYGSNLTSDTVCGPELAFGITMRELTDGPILLIKTAWGGKSLNTDFRPPSAGKYELHPKIQALWDNHPNGAHGIPKMADRPAWRAAKDKATGHYYRLMIKHVKATLSDLEAAHPDYDPKQGYEIAGLVWFQGWNDMCDGATYPDNRNPGAYAQYTTLFAHFIRDVRKELKAPEMPVVVGVIGVGGDKAKGGIANLRPAMTAPAEMPEFAGTVAAVQTQDFWDYPMEALERKKGKVQHRLSAAHEIGADGVIEPRDSAPGWDPIGSPAPHERVWRFTSCDPAAEKDKLAAKEKKRFRQITLPAELKDWNKPEFDDGKWQSGRAPIGKGSWQFRDFPLVKTHSTWGKGEFLLMRTPFEVKNLDYEAFRLSILAEQGFEVYLNGHKIHTYTWWRDDPHYRAIALGKEQIKHLKKGDNVLAVYANCEYDRKTQEAFGAVDVMIEGITKGGLDYVNSSENKLRLMDKECTRDEGKIIAGCSNGGYHYLGSAKMLSQIGEAFAKAMVKLQK
jgi:hypothetical protein